MILHPRLTISRWSMAVAAILLAFPTAASAQTRRCLPSGACVDRGVRGSAWLEAAPFQQSSSEAKAVTVALWPEYDRAEVLVIYRVLLPDSAGLPGKVRLLIPADAPELTAAAYRDSTGKLVNAVNERIDGEQADVVEIQAAGSEVQLEF